MIIPDKDKICEEFSTINKICSWEENFTIEGIDFNGKEIKKEYTFLEIEKLDIIAIKYKLQYSYEYGCYMACSGIIYQKFEPDLDGYIKYYSPSDSYIDIYMHKDENQIWKIRKLF